MTNKPKIYLMDDSQNVLRRCDEHNAFSINRDLLEHQDRFSLTHRSLLKFLNEPHSAAETQKVQKDLREDELDLANAASFIDCIPDPNAREALSKRYDHLQKKITDMDLRLGQDRLACPPNETKGSLPKLLFTVGFPAAFATVLKTMPIRDWVIGCLTGIVWTAAVCVAYKGEIDKKWKSVSDSLCSTCDRTSCIAKQKPESRKVLNAVTVAKCYVRARRKGHTL